VNCCSSQHVPETMAVHAECSVAVQCHAYKTGSTVLYSMLLCSALLNSTLLCSALLHSALLYSHLLYSTSLYSTLLYSTLLCSILLCSTLLILQGSRPDLLPERLLGSVRFSRLDLKTAIPLNPNDYPDDLLDPSPPPSPHPHMSGLSNGSIEHGQSLQSAHSLHSASGSGSITGLDNAHLDGLRCAHIHAHMYARMYAHSCAQAHESPRESALTWGCVPHWFLYMVVAAAVHLMQSGLSSSHEVCGQLPCSRRCLTTAMQLSIDNAVSSGLQASLGIQQRAARCAHLASNPSQ